MSNTLMSKISIEQTERLFEAYEQIISEKLKPKTLRPAVSEAMRIILPRELGSGLDADNTLSLTEKAALHLDQARARDIRLNLVFLALSSNSNAITTDWESSFLVVEPHVDLPEDQREIDSIFCLAIAQRGIASWLSVVNFHLKRKQTVGSYGLEALARDANGLPEVIPAVFSASRPSGITGGLQQRRYFPDAPNGFDWVPLGELSDDGIAGGTGFDVGQVIELKALNNR
jgi:hypothetical protein